MCLRQHHHARLSSPALHIYETVRLQTWCIQTSSDERISANMRCPSRLMIAEALSTACNQVCESLVVIDKDDIDWSRLDHTVT
jgi:hypothetical protein